MRQTKGTALSAAILAIAKKYGATCTVKQVPYRVWTGELTKTRNVITVIVSEITTVKSRSSK